MTDNEILKALWCCIQEKEDDCLLCPLCNEWNCTHIRDCAALDLINRQKAEIERLRENKIVVPSRSQGKTLFLLKRVNDVRTEAIKEFAERLTERIFNCSLVDVYEHIDNLAKEMTGDQSNDK